MLLRQNKFIVPLSILFAALKINVARNTRQDVLPCYDRLSFLREQRARKRNIRVYS